MCIDLLRFIKIDLDIETALDSTTDYALSKSVRWFIRYVEGSKTTPRHCAQSRTFPAPSLRKQGGRAECMELPRALWDAEKEIITALWLVILWSHRPLIGSVWEYCPSHKLGPQVIMSRRAEDSLHPSPAAVTLCFVWNKVKFNSTLAIIYRH